MAQIPTNPKKLAETADVSHRAVADALSGECKKLETLWVISEALNLEWEYLFKFGLKESQFRRAVVNGSSDSA